jgi:hypothetical protein
MLLFKRQQCKKSLLFLMVVVLFWANLVRSKLSRTPKVMTFHGISREVEMQCVPSLSATLDISVEFVLRAFKVWTEIQKGDLLPNYVIHSYDPQSKESADVALRTAVSPALTVLNFGSCTYVLPSISARLYSECVKQLTPVHGEFARVL